MKKHVTSVSVLVGVAAIFFLFVVAKRVEAQSGMRAPGHKADPFEVRMWKWLSQADYRHWAAPAGQKAEEFYPGNSPHGAFLKTHLNRTAAASAKKLPTGSIIVKENFSKEKKLMIVTVMYQSKGYDPAHNDWWYAKYMPDGKVATMKMEGSDKVMKLTGKVQGCINCHEDAGGKDYAFFND